MRGSPPPNSQQRSTCTGKNGGLLFKEYQPNNSDKDHGLQTRAEFPHPQSGPILVFQSHKTFRIDLLTRRIRPQPSRHPIHTTCVLPPSTIHHTQRPPPNPNPRPTAQPTNSLATPHHLPFGPAASTQHLSIHFLNVDDPSRHTEVLSASSIDLRLFNHCFPTYNSRSDYYSANNGQQQQTSSHHAIIIAESYSCVEPHL